MKLKNNDMTMNIYLVTQIKNTDRDAFQSMVVISNSSVSAKTLTEMEYHSPKAYISAWAKYSDLRAQLIGEAKEGSEEKIIIKSNFIE